MALCGICLLCAVALCGNHFAFLFAIPCGGDALRGRRAAELAHKDFVRPSCAAQLFDKQLFA